MDRGHFVLKPCVEVKGLIKVLSSGQKQGFQILIPGVTFWNEKEIKVESDLRIFFTTFPGVQHVWILICTLRSLYIQCGSLYIQYTLGTFDKNVPSGFFLFFLNCLLRPPADKKKQKKKTTIDTAHVFTAAISKFIETDWILQIIVKLILPLNMKLERGLDNSRARPNIETEGLWLTVKM